MSKRVAVVERKSSKLGSGDIPETKFCLLFLEHKIG